MRWRRSRGRSTVGFISHRTVPTTRYVLVYARTGVTTRWLLDVLDIVARDRRVEVFFTVEDDAPSASVTSARYLLTSLRIDPLPWSAAVTREWDLILASSPRGSYGHLCGPLLLTQHGPGFGKPASVLGNSTVPLPQDRGGRLQAARLPATTLVVSHPEQIPLFGSLPASARAVAVGDPLLDQLVASRPMRGQIRRDLGLGPNQRLVLVSSTWGPRSQFARDPDLWRRLSSCLPLDEYRLGMVVHPNVWDAHGPWRVGAWLTNAVDAGVKILSPGDEWRAGVIAADALIVDHGSVGVYGAALGVPILLSSFDDGDVIDSSALGTLGRTAQRLQPDRPLRDQIEEVICSAPDPAWALERLSIEPGAALQRLRDVAYQLMRLEPGEPADLLPRAVERPHSPLAQDFPFVASMVINPACDGTWRCDVERHAAITTPPPPHPPPPPAPHHTPKTRHSKN